MKRTALKPGWKMTEDQHHLFWRLWGQTSKAQGWTGSEAEKKAP
jgi:hypothetical protein